MADRGIAIAAGVGTGLVAVASSAVEAEPVGWAERVIASPVVGSRVRRAAVAPVAARAFVDSVPVVHRASAVAGRAMMAERNPGPEWRVQCV